MKGSGTVLLMTTVLWICTAPVQAGSVTVDGNWRHFTWSGGPGTWNDGGPFTYVSAAWTQLTLTDVAYSGDRFEVYNNGLLIGTTSVPTSNPRYSATCFDYCSENDHWSSGVYVLAPGSQSLTFKTIQCAQEYIDGNAYFRIETTVEPLAPVVAAPTTLVLGMLGTGMVSCLRKRGMF